jgi:hypothetical protein
MGPQNPGKGEYLPGTLKRWRKVPGTPQNYDEEYYYIRTTKKDVGGLLLFLYEIIHEALSSVLGTKG